MCSIASGSSGNCIYAGTDTTHILVDVGLSGKRIEAGLKELDLKGSDIDGILITHEHSDHIAGLGVLSRRYDIPFYCTEGTADYIRNDKLSGKIDESLIHIVKQDHRFSIKDLMITPFAISHDACEPVGYRFCHGNSKSAVCTDLGVYSDYTVEMLKGLDVIYLEANHDVRMLETGPYPYYLKRRILGNRGHLSNEASARLLCSVLHDGFGTVVLSHLSKENNLPDLAYESVKAEIEMSTVPYKGTDFPIQVAKRDTLSEILTF